MAAERVVQADETARIKALRADHLSILCEISGEDETRWRFPVGTDLWIEIDELIRSRCRLIFVHV
jgi:hypothetical protein